MSSHKIRSRALAAAAAVLICAGCGREAPTAFEEPVRRPALVETNVQALQAWASSKARADVLVHIGASDEMAVFSPTLAQTMKNAGDHLARGNAAAIEPIAALIENGGTVNLGHRAGLYRRVIWVIPTAGPVTGVSAEDFRNFWRSKRGYTEAALADLAAAGDHFTVTIDGIPVTVTSLENLELGRETAIINIDLTYFVGLQGRDPSYRPGTASLLDFLRALKARRIAADFVTINRASARQAVPMDIRYYGEIIGEVLEKPALLGPPPHASYAMMIEAEEALVAGRFDDAETRYSDLVERRRGSAGLFFSLALARGFLDRAEGCREALLEAYALDSVYMRGFFQLARVLGGTGRIETGEHLLETPDLLKIIPAIEMDNQRGLFYFNAGRYFDAITFLESVATRRPDDFAVRTVLLRAYEEAGVSDGMLRTLERLIAIDAARVERDMPWVYKRIGELAEKAGLRVRAAEAYDRYMQLVPGDENEAWMRAIVDQYGRH